MKRAIVVLCFVVPSWGTVNSSVGATVAIWGDENDRLADVVGKVGSEGLFDVIVGRNINTQGLPTPLELSQFDAVFVSGGSIQWSTSLRKNAGNLLAQYADQGGGVVTATFVVGSNQGPWVLAGQWADNRYRVMIPTTSQSQGTRLTLGTVLQPSHPIMSDVLSFDGGTSSYRSDITTLAPGSVRIANWSNGEPLIAIKEMPSLGRRVDLNFYPPSSDVRSDFWVASTDGGKIIANSLLWAAVPEPSTLVLALVGFIALSACARAKWISRRPRPR